MENQKNRIFLLQTFGCEKKKYEIIFAIKDDSGIFQGGKR